MGEVLALEFIDPAGQPLRVEWNADALAALTAPPPPGSDPPWALGGELDWDEVGALRIVSGRVRDDLLLAVVALRPRQAQGHGDEVVAGALGDANGFEQLHEALISSEYGPDGALRRIGLELYRDDSGLPIRVAGDAVGDGDDRQGSVRRSSVALELRSAGDEGFGALDVLTAEP